MCADVERVTRQVAMLRFSVYDLRLQISTLQLSFPRRLLHLRVASEIVIWVSCGLLLERLTA